MTFPTPTTLKMVGNAGNAGKPIKIIGLRFPAEEKGKGERGETDIGIPLHFPTFPTGEFQAGTDNLLKKLPFPTFPAFPTKNRTTTRGTQAGNGSNTINNTRKTNT